MDIVCPIDKKDDSIQKISALVAGGTAKGSFSGPTGGVVNVDGKWGYSGGYTTLTGGTTTDLAKKLSPPDKPKFEGLGCLWIPIIYPGAILILVGPSILAVNINGVQYTPSTYPYLLVVFTGIFGIILCFSYIRYFKNIDKRKKEEINNKTQNWDNAFEKWNKLYYCYKHDIVFDPTNDETINSEKINEYCGF